jgi:hypothetical protein
MVSVQDLKRRWTGRQWVGVGRAEGLTSVELSSDAEWNFYQWVGDNGRGLPNKRYAAPSEPDPKGGFSGFGHSDSGGQRWAIGYARPEVQTASPIEDDAEEGERVA